jgi:hypothetical protein
VTSVTVPASVAVLTKRSFRRAADLEVLEFESGSKLRELPTNAFYSCKSLRSICIPRSVVVIHSYAFCDPHRYSRPLPLETITFERDSQLEEIESFAFFGCHSLRSICVPASVAICSGASFASCGLRQIELEAGNETFQLSREFITEQDTFALVRYVGASAEVTIADEIESLCIGCFADCDSIRRITFRAESRLSVIGTLAFADCTALESIYFPSLVRYVPGWCFQGCCSLREISFARDAELGSIGDSAFDSCTSLEVIHLPASVETIFEHCFARCGRLSTITFPTDSKLARIERFAFGGCSSLARLAIPASVTFIGGHCFHQCFALSSLTFVPVSQLRELLDLPPKLAGLQEIPDSVEHLAMCGNRGRPCSRAVHFGPESRLAQIGRDEFEPVAGNRGFLQVSSSTLKLLRSTMEFDRN